MARGRYKKYNIDNKQDLHELYESYKNQYLKSEKYIFKRYKTRPVDEMMSELEFKVNFKHALANNKKVGKSISLKRLATDLATKDVYKFSSADARKIYDTIRKSGIDDSITLGEIRVGTENLWSLTKDVYEKQKIAGMSSTEASIYISKYIFGSP